MTNTTIYACPSPDECPFTTDDSVDLAEHIEREHPGEYKRPDWPDTEAGRAARTRDENEEDDDE